MNKKAMLGFILVMTALGWGLFHLKNRQDIKSTGSDSFHIMNWLEYQDALEDTTVKYIPCIYEDSTGQVVNNCAEIKK